MAAPAAFREVLMLRRKASNDTLRANALRDLVVLLARVGADEVCVLADAAPPNASIYPAEAARLNRARAAGQEHARAAGAGARPRGGGRGTP